MRKEIEFKIEQKMQIEQMEKEMKQNQQELHEKEMELEKLNGVVKERDTELKNKIIELEEIKTMLATEKDNSNKLKRELENNRRDLEEQNRNLQKQALQAEKKLTEELIEKEDELRDAWSKWRKEKEDKERLRREMEERGRIGEANDGELKKKYDLVKEEKQSLKEKVVELERNLEKVKKEREQEKGTHIRSEKQITSIILELENSQKTVKELEQRVENDEELKQKYNLANEERQSLKKKVAELEENLERIIKGRELEKGAHIRSEKQITSIILELDNSQKTVKELERKIENMEAERKKIGKQTTQSHTLNDTDAQKQLEKLKGKIEESLVIEKLIYMNRKVQGEESGEEEENSDNEDEDLSLQRAQKLVQFVLRKVIPM